ncbi:uncharacterized protein TNCT_718301 [Trichonephila clavata]|uniref:Uncharacterized protein n=1 Tax=Trichonephila clavata TaxID=2740835 RepID=A0A8X6F4B5_TRICU|nr:uncharacterized protein TNCT_718301 [Trichonephila clavata]
MVARIFKESAIKRIWNVFKFISNDISHCNEGRKIFRKTYSEYRFKVMSDVVSGTSLKDSTRARLKETSKNIKDDILHKLQSGSGIKRKKSRNKNHLPRAKRSRKNSKAAVDIFS